MRTVKFSVLASVAFGALVSSGPARADQSFDVRAEIFDPCGGSIEKPDLRVRLGEKSTFIINRPAGVVSFSLTIARGTQLSCHEVTFEVEHTSREVASQPAPAGSVARSNGVNSATIACDGQWVTVWRKQPYPTPVMSLYIQPAS
jgi:hypothetical protein